MRSRPLFSLLGFPVYVPWSAWMGIALIAYVNAPAFAAYGGPVSTIAFALGLYATVLLHELAHALAARGTGHRVLAIELGILGGATTYDAERNPNPKHELRVAVAGPLTSLVIGFGLVYALPSGSQSAPVAVLGWLGLMNVLLGFLNLLPAAPLDGGHVCEALVWRITRSRRKGMRFTAGIGFVIGSAMLGNGIGAAGVATGVWQMFLGFILVTNAAALWRAGGLLPR